MASRHGLDVASVATESTRVSVEDVRRHLSVKQTARASGSRKSIAEHMTRAWLTAPHGSATTLADVGPLIELRARHPGMTFTPLFATVLVRALETCPCTTGDTHLGIAVAMGERLLVPVLHRASASNFGAFAAQVDDLVSRARVGRLRPEEMSGGNFTLTNVGVFGALHSQPIIPEGHAGILGVGAIQPRAVARDGYLAVRPCAYLSAVVDRRLIDESLADRLLGEMVSQIERLAL
jgi:pyruvate/2-oxoglutarate dehydrogenase complex dihydrolipoamide acyltransferase (E2) component